MDNTAQLSKSIVELTKWMDTRMTEYETQQQAPSAGTPTVKVLSADYLSFKSMVWKALEMLKSQLELIVNSLDRVETHSRRKVLLFHGVTEEDAEDVTKKILNTIQGQMKLPLVNDETVEVCHRLGVKKDKTRPVLVRFATMKHRSSVWNAKTALKGSSISVSEFLTKPRQDVFNAAKKHFGKKNCWSSEGVIVVLLSDGSRKKVITMSELLLLVNQHPQKTEVPKRQVVK